MTGYIAHIDMGPKIGEGHFGEVFRARDPVQGEVAVKVIAKKPKQEVEDWEEKRAEFLTEARHLATAAHPNIVPVYHLVQSPDGLSVQYCMKFCAGGSLQKAFDDGPSTLQVVRKVGTEVLLGLDALHARGMIHRDLKPGNILLDGNGVARIGDFGLVTDKLIFGYADKAGYNDHLAYEVWHVGVTSVRSDIWALGMTLYRLLHGKAWYEETELPRYEISKGGFSDKLRWLPHIPKRWRRLIRSMMHDDPADRVQSAGQVQSAFSGLPVAPTWNCSVNGSEVLWTQAKGARTIKVVWDRGAKGKSSWRAWSEPTVGSGKAHTLRKSDGLVSLSQANRELVSFFSA